MSIERGKVKFFTSKDNKNFGFIIVAGSDEELFFHLMDGKPFDSSAGSFKEHGPGNPRPTAPNKGDEVVFLRAEGEKGPKARPWGYDTKAPG